MGVVLASAMVLFLTGQAGVGWSPVDGAEGYVVRVDGAEVARATAEDLKAAPEATVRIRCASRAKPYTLTVTAIVPRGEGRTSEPVSYRCWSADANGDGAIDAGDVMPFARALMGQQMVELQR